MTRARSVLLFIDAVWAKNAPADPLLFAQELGYSPKQIGRLAAKHGDGLLAYLEKVRRERTEIPRFMARQHGHAHPPQYVSSRHGAIDDAEAVDEVTQHRLSAESRARASESKTKENEDLIGAMLTLKLALDAMPRDRRRRLGRSMWILRTRLDAAERDLRRRVAA